MRKYEAVVILRPESESIAEAREFLRTLFNGDSCKTVKEEEMGDRELAYEVKKNKRGFYLLYELEAEPQSIPALDKALKLRNDVLKYLFVRSEE
ncbi:MAG: 30S ribosomal protein S6 [Spirochaetales bacterium]|nr:30S ribosomal protein S6 [Spirochaetales bacterium]